MDQDFVDWAIWVIAVVVLDGFEDRGELDELGTSPHDVHDF